MSQPPIVPGQPYQQWSPPPKTPGPPRARAAWILGGALGALVICVVGVLVGLSLNKPAVDTARSEAGPVPAGEAKPAPITVTPAKSDIQLTPKIIRKQCFGSAGCNVDFRVDVAYGGYPIADEDIWLVTYEIRGVEDGPLVSNLELTETGFKAETDSVRLVRKSDEISLAVTDVVKR